MTWHDIWHIGWNSAGCRGLASDWQKVIVLLTGRQDEPSMDEVIMDPDWEAKARLCESHESIQGSLEAVEEFLKGTFEENLARIRRRE